MTNRIRFLKSIRHFSLIYIFDFDAFLQLALNIFGITAYLVHSSW